MAWTTPKTWTAATSSAAELNTHVRDNLDFLYDAGRVRAESSAQTLTTATWTAITWGAESYDTQSQHSTGSNTHRFNALADGLHVISATVGFDSNATGIRGIRIVDDAATILGVHTQDALSGLATAMHICVFGVLSAAEWFAVEAYQSSGGNLDTNASVPMRCFFGQIAG